MVGSNRYGPIALVVTLLVAGVIYLVTTIAADRPVETKAFPVACAVVFIALLAWESSSLLMKRHAAETSSAEAPPAGDAGTSSLAGDAPGQQADTGWSRVATFFGLIVLMAGFAYVATQLDYILGTAVFMAAAMWLISAARSSWKMLTVVPVVSVVAVNLIFVQVLAVRLPTVIPGL